MNRLDRRIEKKGEGKAAYHPESSLRWFSHPRSMRAGGNSSPRMNAGVSLPTTMKLFLLGRPGSGKTSAYCLLESIARREGREIILLSDYPILYEQFIEEKIADTPVASRRFADRHYGGFDVLDFSLCDEVLHILETHVLAHPYSEQENALIVLEFARDDYPHALAQFSPGFLADATCLYIDAAIETCIERIERRVMCGGTHISEDIMRGYYSKHVLPEMLPVEVISNMGTREAFEEQVRRFASMYLKGGVAIGLT